MTATADTTVRLPVATTRAGRLRRIRAVVVEGGLTPSEVRVIVLVVLHGNRDGLAWPGQRLLRRAAHASGPIVARALRRAVVLGHLFPAGRGPRGVARWAVPDVPLDGGGGGGAACREGDTLKAPASAPDSRHAEAKPACHIDTGQRVTSGDPARHIGRFQRGRFPARNHNREPVEQEKREPGGCAAVPPLSFADSDGGNDGGNDGADPDARFARLYSARLGRPCRPAEAARLADAVAEARAAGATPALVAWAVVDAVDGAPWTGPNAARAEARALVAAWAAAGLEPARPTVTAILDDIRFAGRYAGGHEGPTVGEGRARCERVAAWAARHADALRRASTWPGTLHGDGPAQPGSREAQAFAVSENGSAGNLCVSGVSCKRLPRAPR